MNTCGALASLFRRFILTPACLLVQPMSCVFRSFYVMCICCMLYLYSIKLCSFNVDGPSGPPAPRARGRVKVSTSNKTLFEPFSLGLPDGNFRMPGRHPARVESRGILSFFLSSSNKYGLCRKTEATSQGIWRPRSWEVSVLVNIKMLNVDDTKTPLVYESIL